VHLLQHLVDVDGEGLHSSSSGFSVTSGLLYLALGCLAH
jgi:hypothetical protein